MNTDFQLTKLNLTLTVGELYLDSPSYRHTITNNATGIIRRGENAKFSISNATYAILADYKIVPDVGIQVSNVDIVFDIGEETWTVARTYTVLENGEIIEDGLYQGDLKEGVMTTWRGEYEGEPFEKKYEQRAEFLINCGLVSIEHLKALQKEIIRNIVVTVNLIMWLSTTFHRRNSVTIPFYLLHDIIHTKLN